MENTAQNRARVTCARHITVWRYPKNWQSLPEFQNFRNSHGQLCGFVEVTMGSSVDGAKYLTSTVY